MPNRIISVLSVALNSVAVIRCALFCAVLLSSVNQEHASGAVDGAASEAESEDDNEEDDHDYTVFECRGLATVCVSLCHRRRLMLVAS